MLISVSLLRSVGFLVSFELRQVKLETNELGVLLLLFEV